MKNTAELAKDEQLLDARHSGDAINDDVYQLLKAVIGKARSGSWQEAEGELYRLRGEHPFPL